jgi:1-deoxy-D-xylulose-5-phosphate reductoisomerase
MKNIVILGSTGSIGVNALKIIRARPDCFKVVGLVTKSNLKTLAKQIEEFCPSIVSVANKEKAKELRSLITRKVKIVFGEEGSMELASCDNADMVVSAIVGAAGLSPTLAAIRAGKTVALANKEALVAAGDLMMREARANNVKVIPIDSEHSAIYQIMRGETKKSVRRIILTASGGPFLKTPKDELQHVTVKRALRHPNWNMGKKITIDSSTMMNKGLEVIEARWLFNILPSMIDVVIHPQSAIHSMVEFYDSSMMAQMGPADMRSPIAFALNYPKRLKVDLPRLDFTQINSFTFEAPDFEKYPSLQLAYDALEKGGGAPVALNAANEVAVEAFLKGKILFITIPIITEKVLGKLGIVKVDSVSTAISIDKWARVKAREQVL